MIKNETVGKVSSPCAETCLLIFIQVLQYACYHECLHVCLLGMSFQFCAECHKLMLLLVGMSEVV